MSVFRFLRLRLFTPMRSAPVSRATRTSPAGHELPPSGSRPSFLCGIYELRQAGHPVSTAVIRRMASAPSLRVSMDLPGINNESPCVNIGNRDVLPDKPGMVCNRCHEKMPASVMTERAQHPCLVRSPATATGSVMVRRCPLEGLAGFISAMMAFPALFPVIAPSRLKTWRPERSLNGDASPPERKPWFERASARISDLLTICSRIIAGSLKF